MDAQAREVESRDGIDVADARSFSPRDQGYFLLKIKLVDEVGSFSEGRFPANTDSIGYDKSTYRTYWIRQSKGVVRLEISSGPGLCKYS